MIYGVGINDADYQVQDRCGGYICPFYLRWKSMMSRGYSAKVKEKNPAYSDVFVAEEWHRFSTFKRWMESQVWEGLELDKDFLSDRGKVYKADICVFVPKYLNVLSTDSFAVRGEYPLGVCWNKKGNYFQMKCGNGDGTRTTVDCYKSAEAAHAAWQIKKAAVVESLLERYRAEKFFDERVEKVLLDKVSKLREDAASGKQTERF